MDAPVGPVPAQAVAAAAVPLNVPWPAQLVAVAAVLALAAVAVLLVAPALVVAVAVAVVAEAVVLDVPVLVLEAAVPIVRENVQPAATTLVRILRREVAAVVPWHVGHLVRPHAPIHVVLLAMPLVKEVV